MKEIWCWRCKRIVPMLNEEEYKEIDERMRDGIRATQAFRREHGVPLIGIDTREWFKPVLDAYERMTGHRETNHLALYHHRLSIYGPPCEQCGKPLRTPKAKMCAACGSRLTDPRASSMVRERSDSA